MLNMHDGTMAVPMIDSMRFLSYSCQFPSCYMRGMCGEICIMCKKGLGPITGKGKGSTNSFKMDALDAWRKTLPITTRGPEKTLAKFLLCHLFSIVQQEDPLLCIQSQFRSSDRFLTTEPAKFCRVCLLKISGTSFPKVLSRYYFIQFQAIIDV